MRCASESADSPSSRLAKPADRERIRYFEMVLAPALARSGARILGYYVTEASANNFPRLPVREGEHVFIWFVSFADEAAYGRFLECQQALPTWRDQAAHWQQGLVALPEVLRLAPTAHSLIQA